MAAPREQHADSDAELSQSPGSVTEELRAARRSRIACKGWLTRASDSLVKVVSGYDTETHYAHRTRENNAEHLNTRAV